MCTHCFCPSTRSSGRLCKNSSGGTSSKTKRVLVLAVLVVDQKVATAIRTARAPAHPAREQTMKIAIVVAVVAVAVVIVVAAVVAIIETEAAAVAMALGRKTSPAAMAIYGTSS